ncbi:SapC protein [Roseinatronobacter thiooxidans]|uniref:SapC protein n=1 Tax=Roseinatronobacter thiooxidans TaxID=121821 RepID=A0A2W7QC10_9RHOB|nr:SapC family protein [Roseinatronobacter thiooxidans]PZX45703.1 SapC protein [Roseinatronobacter thiooxidans]
MFERAVVLDKQKHQHLRFQEVSSFKYASSTTAAPIAASEFSKVAREFPIAFAREGRFLPVVFLGLHQGRNSCVSEDGRWTADYIPAHLRRYPFVLGDQGNGEDFFVMADLRGLYSGFEGEPVFPEDGNWKDGVLGRAEQFLISFERELKATQELVRPLQDADVLVNKTITLSRADEIVARVSNVSVVDPDRIAALDDATLAAWVRSGLMRLVHLHIESQRNWERLG